VIESAGNDNELIAAHTRCEVDRANRLRQPPTDYAQQMIAGVMAVRIVD
jgi:hypothetical protein